MPALSSAICPELKDRPGLYSQKRDLVNSKKLFPEYKEIPSHTLQDVIARVDKTFGTLAKRRQQRQA